MPFPFNAKNWQDDHASVRTAAYPDGSTKLTILGRYGQILCNATVCLADIGEEPAAGHVFIPDYGDNAGVKDTLQNAGILGRTSRIVETQIHTRDPLQRRPVHECKLLTIEV
jgi:hypothetical protein